MESNKAIRISFYVLMAESMLALLYALVAFILPEFITSHSYPLYTGQGWDTLLDESPAIANYIMILEGAAGGLGMATIIANLFVLLSSYRKGEKWSWYFILVVSFTGWGTDLISNILLRNKLSVIVMAAGLVLLAAALSISARAFLVEKQA